MLCEYGFCGHKAQFRIEYLDSSIYDDVKEGEEKDKLRVLRVCDSCLTMYAGRCENIESL